MVKEPEPSARSSGCGMNPASAASSAALSAACLPSYTFMFIPAIEKGVEIFCFELCACTSELAAMKATSAACSAAAFSAVLKLRIAKCKHSEGGCRR